jgi:hypothetical protein
VNLDRCLRDVARARNHPIAMPLHQTMEDLDLALGQPLIASKRGQTLLN